MIAIRKLSRLGNELHLSANLAAARLVPGHLPLGIVFILLLRRCAEDWVHQDAFRRPEQIRQVSSINAMATSLGKPYATIHRHLEGLIDRGFVIQTGKGVAVANSPENAPRTLALMAEAHDSFVRLAEDFAGEHLFGPPRTGAAGNLHQRCLRAALDAWLVPHEFARKPVFDWTSKLVWLVVVVANVRHITVDPVLSDRYAVEPTPDALRRPITTRDIAGISGLTYGTVYRHCQNLAALKVLKNARGGWLLEARQLNHVDIDQGVRSLIGYFVSRINDLVAGGFDPAAAHGFYLGERREYAALAGAEHVTSHARPPFSRTSASG